MKNIVIVLFLFTSFYNVFAQDAKYIKAIEKNLFQMDSARSANEFLACANNFERIAKAEKNKWIPYYYASYCNVIASFVDSVKSKKDIYLDLADILINFADSLKPENSEIYTVKGLIGQARMSIDPMQRWQKYGAAATNNLQKAKNLDTTNPRPDFLIGQSLIYTPEAFGGGKVKALAVLEEAAAKYNVFKPADSISPNWGKKQTTELVAKLKEK